MKAVFAALLLVAVVGEAAPELVRKNIFVDKMLPWTVAQKYCRMYYVDLSTVNTPWDYLKFKQDVHDYLLENAWVGLSKDSINLIYTLWSDGSVYGTPLWKFGYPVNLISNHCVAINDMLLTDNQCEDHMPFFCYMWAPHMVLVEKMVTWEEALQYCRTHHNDLISVTSDKELNSAKSTSMTSNTSRVWTGLRFMDSSWFWVNKDPQGNLVSMPSCPIKPYHCGALKAGEEVWENRDCSEKMNFLCLH